MGLEVLLYVPNIIGYVRLVLLVISWVFFDSAPWTSCVTYLMAASMDWLDGVVARNLQQSSAFGAWFDVVIDVLGRGMIWCRLYNCGYLVAALEWLTFVCTHTLGTQWKTAFVSEPWFVRKVMAANFKTHWGAAAIAGVHGLPVWLYCHYTYILADMYVPTIMQYLGIGLLAACRALALAVELWCIWSHILYLVSSEANQGMNGTLIKPKPHREDEAESE